MTKRRDVMEIIEYINKHYEVQFKTTFNGQSITVDASERNGLYSLFGSSIDTNCDSVINCFYKEFYSLQEFSEFLLNNLVIHRGELILL